MTGATVAQNLFYPRSAVRAGAACVVSPVAEVTTTPSLAPDAPCWASVSPDGSLTLTPPLDARAGIWRVTVQIGSSEGGQRSVVAVVDVEAAADPEAQIHQIDPWCEVALAPGMPGGVTVITVDDGHPLPPGARVEAVRRGSRLRCTPVSPDALWVSAPRLRRSVRVRVVYGDGSTDVADAGLRLRDGREGPAHFFVV